MGEFVPIFRLRRLLSTPQPLFTPLHYAEAWSFVYFLIHADDGRNADVLNRYFILIQQREDPVEAFAKAFRAPLANVEKAWCAYVDELLKQNPVPKTGQPSGSTRLRTPSAANFPVFDAQRTRYDVRYMPGPLDDSQGVLTVEYLRPITDEEFDLIVAAVLAAQEEPGEGEAPE